jgi:hypothetical protein
MELMVMTSFDKLFTIGKWLGNYYVCFGAVVMMLFLWNRLDLAFMHDEVKSVRLFIMLQYHPMPTKVQFTVVLIFQISLIVLSVIHASLRLVASYVIVLTYVVLCDVGMYNQPSNLLAIYLICMAWKEGVQLWCSVASKLANCSVTR